MPAAAQRRRSPFSTSRPIAQHLAAHLFNAWPTPAFVWNELVFDEELSTIIAQVSIARGGSLARLSRADSRRYRPVPTRFAANLRDVPPEQTFIKGLAFAEVYRLGGTLQDAQFMSRHLDLLSPLFNQNPDSQLKAARRAALWMIRNRKELYETPNEVEMISGWVFEHTINEGASMKGRTVQSVRRHATDFTRYGLLPRRWERRGWDWSFQGWSMLEMICTRDLFEESRTMHHCVDELLEEGAQGRSAFFSLRKDNKRRLTVRIHPKTFHVIEARGQCNRHPDTHEEEALERWLDALRQKVA